MNTKTALAPGQTMTVSPRMPKEKLAPYLERFTAEDKKLTTPHPYKAMFGGMIGKALDDLKRDRIEQTKNMLKRLALITGRRGKHAILGALDINPRDVALMEYAKSPIEVRAYAQGFANGCAQYGVDPDELVKHAQTSRWWDYLAGFVPFGGAGLGAIRAGEGRRMKGALRGVGGQTVGATLGAGLGTIGGAGLGALTIGGLTALLMRNPKVLRQFVKGLKGRMKGRSSLGARKFRRALVERYVPMTAIGGGAAGAIGGAGLGAGIGGAEGLRMATMD